MNIFLMIASVLLLAGLLFFLRAAVRFHRELVRMKADDAKRFGLPTRSARVESLYYDHGLPVRRVFLRRTALADVLGMRL